MDVVEIISMKISMINSTPNAREGPTVASDVTEHINKHKMNDKSPILLFNTTFCTQTHSTALYVNDVPLIQTIIM